MTSLGLGARLICLAAQSLFVTRSQSSANFIGMLSDARLLIQSDVGNRASNCIECHASTVHQQSIAEPSASLWEVSWYLYVFESSWSVFFHLHWLCCVTAFTETKRQTIQWSLSTNMSAMMSATSWFCSHFINFICHKFIGQHNNTEASSTCNIGFTLLKNAGWCL